MLSVSEAYSRAIISDHRNMPYRITLAGAVVLDRSSVPKMTLDESVSGGSAVAIGTSNSATLKLTLKDAAKIDYNDLSVVPESGLELEDGTIKYVPLGKFWVTDFETSDDYKTLHLTCCDGMYHLTGTYESKLKYPSTVKAMVKEIVADTGIEFNGLDSLPDIPVRRKPKAMPYREAVGYLAGCCGKNARFNRYGELEFVWYTDSGLSVERATQYLGGMTKLNNKPLNVKFEVTGQQEKYSVTVISDGNGGVTVTPGEELLEGETVVLSVQPFSGYELATVSAVNENGENITLYKRAEGGYDFIQPDSNVTVTASFRTSANGPFRLIVRAYDGGFIEFDPSGHEAGDDYFNEGDEVSVRICPNEGMQIDEIVTTPGNIDVSQGTFIMPKSDVTITASFKEEEEVVTAYSWLQKPPTPLTDKPYWAMFYNENEALPTCQKYYLVWFDSWEATKYSTDYGFGEYEIQFNGYYICGSKNNGHGKHEWDTSVWGGNGDASSTLSWDACVDRMRADWDEYYGPSSQYCLLASNVDLTYNGDVIFEECADVIPATQTGYLLDGMDIREQGSLTQWLCPDTFSTPAPASHWMILMPDSGLYMTMGEDGKYQTPVTSYPKSLIAFYYDAITIQNVGALLSDSDEEVYIASFVNGRWTYLRDSNLGWDEEIHDLPEGAVVGLRSPLVSTASGNAYLDSGNYNFAGVLATSKTLLDTSGKLFMYNNACRICQCSAEPSKFLLKRSATAPSDAIVIDGATARAEDDAIVLEGVSAEVNGDAIVLTTSPSETENVTISYTNPLIYEKMIPAISACVKGITYTPARVKHRGNPAFQAGDVITAPDRDGVYHTVLIMQQTMNFGGGMNSEISCPGQTKKRSDFSANGPITTQIKNEVQKSNADIEHRIAANNALVFAALHKSIGSTEAKVSSVVEWQTATSATISKIEQTASKNEAKIALVVGQNGIVNENGAVQGGIIIQAINGETSAKISADRLDIEGKTLNIKVDAMNITGEIFAQGMKNEITVGEKKYIGAVDFNATRYYEGYSLSVYEGQADGSRMSVGIDTFLSQGRGIRMAVYDSVLDDNGDYGRTVKAEVSVYEDEILLVAPACRAQPYTDPSGIMSNVVTKQDLINLGLISE